MKRVGKKFPRIQGKCVLGMALLVSALSAAQDSAMETRCPSPEAVLQRYINALGGEAAIPSILTRASEADETEPYSFKPQDTAHYTYKFEWEAPGKAVIRAKHKVPLFGIPVTFSDRHFIFDGKAWSDYRGQSLPHQRNEQLGRQGRMFDYPEKAMWRIAADPLMVARPSELYSGFALDNDREASSGICTVRAKGKDQREDILYFDAATGLLKTWALQMAKSPNPFYLRIDFDDYRQAGPVKFPFFLYFDVYRATFRYTKVDNNRLLQDSDFDLK